MTSIDTWSPWIAIIVIGGWSLLAAAGLVFSLYLSRCHLDAIKEALKNSRYIYVWGPSLGKRGLIWSVLEIAKISGMIMMPKASIRIGELDPVDLENFPPHLKRLLKIKSLMLVTTAVWLSITAVLIKFK
ncbi:hypothetical protein [Pseudomonas sp. IT-P176]|uniref:hypothetical protein n=1 Tax=Pseudomonas sp. IT-P176 TaxID=3026444 RepID=UPI0039E1F20A